MGANETQVGGAHYKKSYQHWDLMVDLEVPYLLGCASKYPTRWREKNGLEDLRKSMHYIQKAKEEGVRVPQPNKFLDNLRKLVGMKTRKETIDEKIGLFCHQLASSEAIIVSAICYNDFENALVNLSLLIRDMELSGQYIKG